MVAVFENGKMIARFKMPDAVLSGSVNTGRMTREAVAATLKDWTYGPGPQGKHPAFVSVPSAWAAANIVPVPGFPRLRANRAIAAAIGRALSKAIAQGAVIDWATTGSYVTRRGRWESTRPPGYHSAGLAIDVNWQQARVPDGVQDPRIVAAFKEEGFIWGGDWGSYRDPMHFEIPWKFVIKEPTPGSHVGARVLLDGQPLRVLA